MYKFKNISKEQQRDYISQSNDVTQLDAIFIGLRLGCYKDDVLIGIIQYNPRFKEPYFKHYNKYPNITMIGLLHVKEECRKHGIGSMLLSEIYKRTKDDKALVLKADEEEFLRDFYIKNGFREIEEWLFIKSK